MKPPVQTFQAPWELDQLVAVYDRLNAERVLEIGCWHGGTLWHWLQPGVTVVAVDDEMRSDGDWQDWAEQADATLYAFQGNSHDPDVVKSVADHAPFDFVFIDADHTYRSVRADWDNYSPFLAAGGAVAFHDILPRDGYGVSELWAEVKALPDARWMEIGQNQVEPGNEGWCGIGIVWP